MLNFIIGSGILILSSIVLGGISAFIQRRKVGYQGHLSGPGELRIRGAGAPTVDPAQIIADIDEEDAKSTAALGAQISASIEETDFKEMGAAQPIKRHVTTYLAGDDLYEESYRVETPAGESLGEIGVSLLEPVTLGDDKNVVAIELWLFDMTDGTTGSKILVTPEASQRQGVWERLEPKGEIVTIAAGDWISLDSSAMRLRARIVDLAVKQDSPAPGLFYERLILEIAIWESDGSPVPIAATDEVHPDEEESGEDDSTLTSVLEQQVKVNYLVEYPQRLFVRQPFTLKVIIPGGMEAAGRPAQTDQTGDRRRATPGTLTFTHQQPRQQAERAPDYPQVGVGLMFNPEEIYVPTTNQTATLIPGEVLELDYLIKPLRAETVVMKVDFHHLGKSYVPEKQLEITETKDLRTGEVVAVSTRKAPDRYTEAITMLGSETLSIKSVSFLGLGAGAFKALVYVIGLILSGALVGWALLVVGFETYEQIYITVGGVLLSLLILGWMQRRRQ